MTVAVSLAMTSCMDGDDGLFNDDWKDIESTVAPYGNNALTEDGVITIADLKSRYANVISGNKKDKVTENLKIKGRISGNDIGGNIYKQVNVQDATGGIVIGINKAGLSGYMPEGQEILIDLKDLYVGGYGGAAQIGYPYNGGIGRMAESIWMNHFKLIGTADPSSVQPVEFTTESMKDDGMVGKLVILKNVTFKDADGKKRLIDGTPQGTNYYHQELDGYGKNLVIRTSSYADFAATIMPFKDGQKQQCDIIGIASKYNTTWQIMIRKSSDIQVH